MPIHTHLFLPARRTDLVGVKDLDLDELHRRLWAESNARENHRINRPGKNNRLFSLLIGQGRCRRMNGRFYVKDPEAWEAEVIDFREFPVPEGRVRCQFCGLDFEAPRKQTFVACWSCAELIGIQTSFFTNMWDEKRDLIR